MQDREISVFKYLLFWASITIVFSRLAFRAFDETGVSHIVPPLILSLFKHFFAVLASFAVICAFLSYQPLKFPFKWIVVIAAAPLALMYYVVGSLSYWAALSTFIVCNFVGLSIPEGKYGEFKMPLIVHLVIGSTMVLVGHDIKRCLICAAPCIALSIYVTYLVATRNSTFGRLLDSAATKRKFLLTSIETKWGQIVDFGVGMLCSILFQHYFILTSFNHVLPFIFLVVAWLANLALHRVPGDMGILYFLICNVTLESIVSIYKLGAITWVAYAIILFLLSVHVMLQSLLFSLERRWRRSSLCSFPIF